MGLACGAKQLDNKWLCTASNKSTSRFTYKQHEQLCSMHSDHAIVRYASTHASTRCQVYVCGNKQCNEIWSLLYVLLHFRRSYNCYPVWSAIGIIILSVRPSMRLSVRLPVTPCIVALSLSLRLCELNMVKSCTSVFLAGKFIFAL